MDLILLSNCLYLQIWDVWRSKVKTKARKVRDSINATGGGPGVPGLNDDDNKILDIIGPASVYGFANLEQVSFRAIKSFKCWWHWWQSGWEHEFVIERSWVRSTPGDHLQCLQRNLKTLYQVNKREGSGFSAGSHTNKFSNLSTLL